MFSAGGETARGWIAGSGSLARHAAAWTGGSALILLCLAAYLPGLNAVPPMDGDEARYAEAAREMLAAENWRFVVVPHIGGAPRINKPPGTYWAEATSAYLLSGGHPSNLSYPAALKHDALAEPTTTGSPVTRSLPFTGGIWTFRVPSVLATIVAVLITWRLGLTMFAPPCAWLAAALLGGCFLVVLDARLARTDQLLLACTCAAQWGLWHVWRDGSAPNRWVFLFWFAVGLGILVKGPVTPGVAAMTIAALCLVAGELRWLRRLRFGCGFLILAAIFVPPTAIAIGAVGWKTLADAVLSEVFERGISASGGRAGPPGYHLVLLPGLFWPGGLLVVPAFIYALRRGLRWEAKSPRSAGTADSTASNSVGSSSGRRFILPGRKPELFCLAWLVPSWLLLEFIGTKLPHYPLPLYPAMALLCGRAAWAGIAGTLPLVRTRAAALGDAAWLLIGWSLLAGLPLGLAWFGHLRREPGSVIALLANVLVATTLLVVGWRMIRRGRFVTGLLVGLAVSILGSRGLFETILPNLQSFWISSAVVQQVAAIDPDGSRPLVSAGYFRESLAFLTGGHAERLPVSRLHAWLDEHPNGLAIVAAGADLQGHPTKTVAMLSGFDYVEGQPITLSLIESQTP